MVHHLQLRGGQEAAAVSCKEREREREKEEEKEKEERRREGGSKRMCAWLIKQTTRLRTARRCMNMVYLGAPSKTNIWCEGLGAKERHVKQKERKSIVSVFSDSVARPDDIVRRRCETNYNNGTRYSDRHIARAAFASAAKGAAAPRVTQERVEEGKLNKNYKNTSKDLNSISVSHEGGLRHRDCYKGEQIRENEVHLWLLNTKATTETTLSPTKNFSDKGDEARSLISRCLNILSEEESRQLPLFDHERHSIDCEHIASPTFIEKVLSRALLRTTAARYCIFDPKESDSEWLEKTARDIEIRQGKWGKPIPTSLANSRNTEKFSRLAFNVSHTDGNIICCVTTSPLTTKSTSTNLETEQIEIYSQCGVDIEKLNRTTKYDFLKIAEQKFSQEEFHIVGRARDCNEKQRLFFGLWTLKESIAKALGTGIGALSRLKDIKVDLSLKEKRCNFANHQEDAQIALLRHIQDDLLVAICLLNRNDREIKSSDSLKSVQSIKIRVTLLSSPFEEIGQSLDHCFELLASSSEKTYIC